MPVSPISAIAPAAAGKSSSPERIQEAAEQFESLLISQMLKSAREGGGWGIDEEEGQEGAPLIGMAEEQLGNILASQGGLGLSRLIVRQMSAATKNLEEIAHTPSVVSDKLLRVAESHADR
ncbi:MAG: hypothetical protein WD696_22430 [Bryobacteraceae bacterium]